jgi:hypothetical protein
MAKLIKVVKPKPVTERHRNAFRRIVALIHPSFLSNIGVISAIDKQTGASTAVLAWIDPGGNEGNFKTTPLARLFDGDPADEISTKGIAILHDDVRAD